MSGAPNILIVNTSDDTVEALTELLEHEGFVVDAAIVREMRAGRTTIEHVTRHDPDLIIFDLAPPYETNWRYFADVFSKHPRVVGKPFVLTTTNRAAVDRIVGDTGALELLLKPFDLDELLRRVKQGLSRRA